jgi:hypothetical protein
VVKSDNKVLILIHPPPSIPITFLQAQGFDVWKSIVDGYVVPTTPPIDKDGNKLSEKNSKAKGTILRSLDDSLFLKVMHRKTSKDIWDKIQNIYEGDTKVKGAKFKPLERSLIN